MFHEPVLVTEVLEFLRPTSGTVVDATCGGGGHARAILELLATGGNERRGPGRLLGLDLDPEAIASAQRYLGQGSSSSADCRPVNPGVAHRESPWILRQASYVDMVTITKELKLAPVTGVLFDFGVSLHQVRTPGRGFSYDLDGPLDMRFDPGSGPTALELLRRAKVEDLRNWLREYGELPQAGRLARRIHECRGAISTTGDLAAVVKRAVHFRQARRTLARVFQAFRIVTNDELDAVGRGLEAAMAVLVPSGRLVTICYHSLEDRICKLYLRKRAAEGRLRLLARRAVRPQTAEVERNRAARSARLRAAEKTGEDGV